MGKRESPDEVTVRAFLASRLSLALFGKGISKREVLHRYWAFSGGKRVHANELLDLLEKHGCTVSHYNGSTYVKKAKQTQK